MMQSTPILEKTLGSTGQKVTCVGLGGEGVLRTHGRDEEAREVIEAALSAGITYFDSANAYAGSQEYLGRVWKERPDVRRMVFQTSKSAMRHKSGVEQDLDRSLAALGTDYLDLWQIHDVRTREDIAMIEARDGALEGFVRARDAGRVRHIGVTGHHDPDILLHAVREWPVDTVLLPVNPAEKTVGGFLDRVIPAARERGIGIVAMKVLGGGHYVQPRAGVTADLLLEYALSEDVDVAIAGCSTPGEAHSLADAGRDFDQMSEDEKLELEITFESNARRLAFYRG
ncbi:MAG: aldo/keto reductase [Desulfatibacillaceae bacterium]